MKIQRLQTDQPADSGHVLVWVLIVIVLIWLLGSCLAGGGENPGDVGYECHQAVEAQVSNPDTIDWAWTSEEIDGSKMTGEFTARNDFNAKLSYWYTCEVTGSTASATVYRR